MNNLPCVERFASSGEAAAARRLVRLCLAEGFLLSVNDGEEWTVRQSTDFHEIYNALCTTGADTLSIGTKVDGKYQRQAAFCLVWGNAEDGSELVADYTDNELAARLVTLSNS